MWKQLLLAKGVVICQQFQRGSKIFDICTYNNLHTNCKHTATSEKSITAYIQHSILRQLILNVSFCVFLFQVFLKIVLEKFIVLGLVIMKRNQDVQKFAVLQQIEVSKHCNTRYY